MDEITTPEDRGLLVKLPWATEVFLCRKNLHRWLKNEDGTFSRDYHGEAEWAKMANYVGQSYEDVATSELNYALSKASA